MLPQVRTLNGISRADQVIRSNRDLLHRQKSLRRLIKKTVAVLFDCQPVFRGPFFGGRGLLGLPGGGGEDFRLLRRGCRRYLGHPGLLQRHLPGNLLLARILPCRPGLGLRYLLEIHLGLIFQALLFLR